MDLSRGLGDVYKRQAQLLYLVKNRPRGRCSNNQQKQGLAKTYTAG
jgi:hypothetical protein